MVVGELSKPKVMDFDTDQDRGCCDCPPRHEGENRSITVMLGENDKLVYYIGILASPIIAPKELQYGKDGIRRELLKRKNVLKSYSKSTKPESLIVIIKPSKKSTYKNLIDILDEMAITNINTYVIVPEFTPEESKLLAVK